VVKGVTIRKGNPKKKKKQRPVLGWQGIAEQLLDEKGHRGRNGILDEANMREAGGGGKHGVLQCGLGSLAESFIPKERGHSAVGASLGSFTSLLLSTETRL